MRYTMVIYDIMYDIRLLPTKMKGKFVCFEFLYSLFFTPHFIPYICIE